MERKWTGDSRRLSRTDRGRIEQLIRSGESFATAAGAVGCSVKSVQRYLALTGGLKSRGRERSPRYLSLAEREELSRGLMAGESFRALAARLKRAPSTVSREVSRNGHRSGYRAWHADDAALERGRRPKPEKLSLNTPLCREVERGLRAWWSPQQIAARLAREYPDDPAMRISHETIYKSLFVQARGVLMMTLARFQIPVVEFPPMQIKLALAGHGHAEKDDVLAAVMRELNLDTPPRPDDAADALAAALTRWFQR